MNKISETDKGKRKVRIGKVVSNKMNKTVVVEVERRSRHAKFNRVMTSQKRFKAHDENNECNIDDKVAITETRPISKDKRWRVSEVIERAKEISVLKKEAEVEL